jgi:Type II secretion system (T2SS), protein E, N-terminal domain
MSDWFDSFERGRTPVQEQAIVESLARRARPGERPEELLFDLGLLDEQDFALEIASAAGRPFSGLRDFVPDPRLFVYLPVPIAVRERVCPLVLTGSSLRVASAFLDPDLSQLERRFPSLAVDLGIAPRSEILAALNRVTELL